MSKSIASSILNQIIIGALFSALTYCTVIALLSNLSFSIQEHGLLKPFINLSEWTEYKARAVSENMREKNLAMNFLGNLRKLSFDEAKAFQSSGLIHLLAISGGQIVPLANGFSFIIGYFLYLNLYKKMKPNKLMLLIFNIKSYCALIISFLICFSFGCTGALIRVSALSYLPKLKIFQSQYSLFFNFIPYIISNSFNRIMIIIFISFSFGNVFINYSFLLSALGATIAEISTYITNFFITKPLIFQIICNTILTSFFTGIILFPLTKIDIINSCFSNILALPVVCFFITPLSLLALFLPSEFFLYQYILMILDISLVFLKKIAFTFYNPYSNTNPFDKNNPMFSLQGLIYLNIILILLWISIDIFKEKKVFIARKKFLK